MKKGFFDKDKNILNKGVIKKENSVLDSNVSDSSSIDEDNNYSKQYLDIFKKINENLSLKKKYVKWITIFCIINYIICIIIFSSILLLLYINQIVKY